MKRVLLFIYCSLGTLSARGDLVMSLSSSVQGSAHGVELVFSGTLTNTDPTQKLFLNDIAPTLSGASLDNLIFEPNSFFSNVPGILLPNESYSNSELFRVVVSGSAPPGDYGGTVTIRGGSDIFANNDLATADFTILSPDIPLVVSLDDGYLTLSFAPNDTASDVNFIVEGSTDLTNWSTADVEQVQLQNPNPPTLQTYRYKNPISLTSKAFLRLRITRTQLLDGLKLKVNEGNFLRHRK